MNDLKLSYIAVLLALALSAGSASELRARIVKGIVTCGDEKLSKVIVTDGKNFTRTNKNGSFKMDIADSAQFVYIITPSGYCADWSSGAPEFYRKADGKDFFEFDLIKTGDPSSKYNIIAIGDPQPSKMRHCEEYAGEPLNDVRKTVSELEGPAVGLVLGDVCFNVYNLMGVWKESVKDIEVPFYAVPGNHDHVYEFKEDKKGISEYNNYFGPENYAFFIGKDMVIMLDNIILGMKSGKHNYCEGYTDGVISWVKDLMKYVPKNTYVYVGQHSPLNGRSKNNEFIHNGQRLVDALKGHQVHFISGHNHVNYNFDYAPGIIEHNVAALCGTWWDAYHCTDGTPRGYKVYTKTDNRLEWYYKSIGKDKNFQYEIFRPGECKMNPDSWVLNVWDVDSAWSVEWFEDSKHMGRMKQVQEYSPIHKTEIEATFARKNKPVTSWKRTRKGSHYFAATPSPEAKKITFLIKNRFGGTWTETFDL